MAFGKKRRIKTENGVSFNARKFNSSDDFLAALGMVTSRKKRTPAEQQRHLDLLANEDRTGKPDSPRAAVDMARKQKATAPPAGQVSKQPVGAIEKAPAKASAGVSKERAVKKKRVVNNRPGLGSGAQGGTSQKTLLGS